ncbi:SAYSvFN domain-containing protein 1 [Diachasmimorpha longicaudata]|uniref:SAYSvFN domain-containing protein 1 n=1 Tax=Diachasmimorpha longicaudata TaxID=58733 RepID=UPI0030B8AADC
MEAKLEAYRTKKRREAMVEKAKNSIKGVLSWKEQPVPLLSQKLEDRDDLESITSEESIDLSPQRNSTITQVTYFLYFLLWATLYVIALQFEFGAVYFILSALLFIWKNTRSGPKKKGEISAYSVFNPNCEAIQGSINMEQIEREMGWGTHS